MRPAARRTALERDCTGCFSVQAFNQTARFSVFYLETGNQHGKLFVPSSMVTVAFVKSTCHKDY
jgi:hypothetical protein